MTASPPGDTIKDIMDEQGISRFKLGRMLKLSDKKVMDLLEGKFLLDNNMACRLSEALGSTTQFWENREKQYRDNLLNNGDKLIQLCFQCEGGVMEWRENGWYCTNPECGFNYVVVLKQKVWVVSLHTFDWCFLRHICKTKETAIKYWEEIRNKCIKQNDRVIKQCNERGYSDTTDWEYCNEILRNLNPGEIPPTDDTRCDEYPTMDEWVVD